MQRVDCEPHHDFRPADESHRMLGIHGYPRDQRRDNTDIAAPIGRRMVDGDHDIDIEAPSPHFELAPKEDVTGAAGAIKHDDPAVPFAASEYAIDRGPQRRQPEPASDNDDIAAF